MNDEVKKAKAEVYNQRQESKKNKYEYLAKKSEERSFFYAKKSNEMAQCIPFGQPILVGHHSEKSDRNFRAKIHSTMGQSVRESEKAKYYENKLNSLGKGGISSDDPNAIDKLKAKLESLQISQERMKAANKLIRKYSDKSVLKTEIMKLGITEKTTLEVLNPRYGSVGFASYQLQNNNAEINRLKKRILELEVLENKQSETVENDLYKYKECKIENRCMFEFEGKPSEDIRTILKSNGFKWSPSRGAWVRQLNANGIYSSNLVMKLLNNINTP